MPAPPARGADAVFTPRTPRVVAARRLQRRRDRDGDRPLPGRGPAGGPRGAGRPGVVTELFGTADGARPARRPGGAAAGADVPVSEVTDEALAALAETVTPQGLVAVCRHLDVPLDAALAGAPRLVAVLADIRDPGNAGTVLRTADAAGAGAVVFAGDAVDPYNGKCVRASRRQPLPRRRGPRRRPAPTVVDALRAAGLQVLAATGYGDSDLDDLADAGRLAAPDRLAVRLRGARPARGADRRRRRPGPGAAPRRAPRA